MTARCDGCDGEPRVARTVVLRTIWLVRVGGGRGVPAGMAARDAATLHTDIDFLGAADVQLTSAAASAGNP